MKIEAGNYYRTRDGRKLGPAKRYYPIDHGHAWSSPYNACEWEVGPYLYQPDGTFWDNAEPARDLVSEWQDEPTGPVVTETVKRIKPGVYGCIQVVHPPPHNALSSCVQIGLHYNSELVTNLWVTPTDLRAAAAVFIEIADALDDAK